MAPSAGWMVVDLVSLVLAKVFIGHFLKQVRKKYNLTRMVASGY